MYTEDIAKNMSCILSNEMKDHMLQLYNGGEAPSSILFEEFPNCIASECTHWKFDKNNIHGCCTALDEVLEVLDG
jgi:hypothetical protein